MRHVLLEVTENYHTIMCIKLLHHNVYKVIKPTASYISMCDRKFYPSNQGHSGVQLCVGSGGQTLKHV